MYTLVVRTINEREMSKISGGGEEGVGQKKVGYFMRGNRLQIVQNPEIGKNRGRG